MYRTKLRFTVLPLATALMLCALGACGSERMKEGTVLDKTLYEFSSDIRWSDFEAAYAFVDPASKTEHPMTDIDRERYKQIEVSTYQVLSKEQGPGTVDQQIRLELINRNTQIPRSMTYHEHWRYDELAKHWLLTTGLPDITAGQ
ncbi:MAG TPA: hypothetical protein VGH80_02525 [Xanthomonadaceae bacterium]|jgi:hypothetical protein